MVFKLLNHPITASHLIYGGYMTKKKALLIDDNETILNTYSSLLREEGYCVVTAKSGIRVLRELCHHSFDLVIIDLAMKNGGGFTILGVIKVLSPDIPLIVFLNGRSEIARKSVSLLKTCTLIEKPCNHEMLISSIRSSSNKTNFVLPNAGNYSP